MKQRKTESSTKCPHCNGHVKTHTNLCETHLKELQKKWYKKLETKGFKDIEDEAGSIKKWSFIDYHSLITYNAKEEYYRLAYHFLEAYKFKNHLEHRIWELHANGVSYRGIAKELTKDRIKTDRWRVETIVLKLRRAMKCYQNESLSQQEIT